MKKTIKSLLAIAVAAFAFTACSDVPQPEGYNNNTGDVVPFEHTGSGTKADPYTSTDAINYAKSLGGKESTNFVFIKGKVSRIETSFTASGTYGNGVFYISDDGTADANKEFYVYRALYLGNQKFASSDTDIKVGDDVVVYGRIVNYNSKTPETVSGTAFLYSLNGVDRGGADDDPGTVVEPKGSGTEADPFNVAAAIKKCEEVGETASTDKYYIKGIANADFTVTNYGNVEVDIIDEGATSKTFKVYRCKGNNNQSIPSGYQVHKGDVIIVYGPVVNFKGNTPETATGAYIVSINGADPAGGSGGGGEVTPGTPSGTGTLADPFNVAAAVKKCQEVGETATTENFYVKGIVEADYTVDSYKNATFNLIDAEGATQKFTAYRVIGPDGKKLKEGYKIAKGANVVVCGKLVNFRGNTPETAQNSGFIVTVNGQAPELDDGQGGQGGGGESGGGGEATDLTNGGFEEWSEGAPTGWTSKASSATIEKSTNARSGSASVLVKGDAGYNKRLASQELALKAGTYVFSYYAKATTEDVAQARAGWVPYKDGAPVSSSYKYGDFTNINTTGWTLVSIEFTLNEDTTVSVIGMNPKATAGKTSGKDILVDDATLTKK